MHRIACMSYPNRATSCHIINIILAIAVKTNPLITFLLKPSDTTYKLICIVKINVMCAYHELDLCLNPKRRVCLAANGMGLNRAVHFSRRCETKNFC